MKQLTKEQRRNIRDILEDKSCAYCKHLVSKISWWCGNEDAITARGTRLPGVIHCPYFKIDKNYTRKELKIKKLFNKKIAKIVNTILCIILLVFILMRMIYNAWSMFGHSWISFFSSLIILGGFIGMMYLGIKWVLNKILKYKK